jgi:hypothetical protein
VVGCVVVDIQVCGCECGCARVGVGQGCTSRPGIGINNKIWAVPEGQPKAGPGLPEIAAGTAPAIPGDPVKLYMQFRVDCSELWE